MMNKKENMRNSNITKVLVTDLDGTICEQIDNKNYQSAKPRLDVIKKINSLWTEGWEIIIFTARGMNTFEGDVKAVEQFHRSYTEKWLKDNRVCYNKLLFGKPSADLYLDDKNISINDFVKDKL